jgi:hypothetical protein
VSLDGWKALFDELTIDTPARQALACLAQHSDEGWRRANSIVAKLIVKLTKNRLPHRPSAWVNRSVINSRHEMAGGEALRPQVMPQKAQPEQWEGYKPKHSWK